jgi:CheY-like chemotaxis protein
VAVAGVGVAEVPKGSQSQALARIGVLIVAEDDDRREMLAVALSQYGAEVRTVASVGEAVTAIQGEKRPQVIVASARGNDSDLALIRSLDTLGGSGGRIPAIAVTANQDPQHKARLLAAGYHAHLTMPLSSSALVTAVLSLARIP